MSKEKPGKKTSRGFDGLAELKPILEHRQMQQSSGDEQQPPKNTEAPQEERMTEEELLAGLEGLAATPARKEAEVAMRKYFDRLQSGETPAQIHDAVVANLSQEAYMEFRHILDVYERQEEIGAIEKKWPAVQKEQQPAKANDTLDVITKDKKRSQPEAVGSAQKAPDKDLVNMGNTAKEIREYLGEPAGKVDGISYWLLPDGAAAMLSGGPPEHRKLQRWGEGGFQKIKGVYYEYKDGAFKKMTNEEGLAREKAMREVPQKPKALKKKARGPKAARGEGRHTEASVEAPAQIPDSSRAFKRAFDKLDELRRTGVPRADQIALASRGLSDAEFTEFEQLVKKRDKEREDQKKAEKAAANTDQSESRTAEQAEERAERKEARSFKEMHRIFNKKKREGLKTGPAFKAAVEGQALDRARKFKKELEEDGESHGLLEGAMRELEQNHEKNKTDRSQDRETKIEEMVDAMFSAPPRSVAESVSQSEQDKDIDSLVERIFASNASSR